MDQRSIQSVGNWGKKLGLGEADFGLFNVNYNHKFVDGTMCFYPQNVKILWGIWKVVK